LIIRKARMLSNLTREHGRMIYAEMPDMNY